MKSCKFCKNNKKTVEKIKIKAVVKRKLCLLEWWSKKTNS